MLIIDHLPNSFSRAHDGLLAMFMAAESRRCVSGMFRRTWTPAAALVFAALALLGGGARAAGGAVDTNYVASVFETPNTNGSFLKLMVNQQTQDVYIGAVDYIYR